MLPDKVIPQAELLSLMRRFIDDPNRVISMELFADLAGIHFTTLRNVFHIRTEPMTEYVQRRVSKAYLAYTNGEVAVMRNHNGSRFLKWRDTPKPRMARTQRLKVVNGKIQLDIGIKNRHDYSIPSLDEQMR